MTQTKVKATYISGILTYLHALLELKRQFTQKSIFCSRVDISQPFLKMNPQIWNENSLLVVQQLHRLEF